MIDAWLLAEPVLRALEQAHERGWEPTAEQAEVFAAEASARKSTARTTAADGAVEIQVNGVLTKRPDILARIFGGGNTTYDDISSALRDAALDPSVKRTVLAIDSPGGEMAGLFDALGAIGAYQATGKKLSVRATRAQSAAYALAAAAGKITATNPGAEFGSVGVALSAVLRENEVSLTNTESPDKRPDLTTDEGKKTVVKYLDQVYELFAKAIADGRGVPVDTVKEDFGRGASMLAAEAKRRGMIDSIAKPVTSGKQTTTAEAGGQPEQERIMDLQTLKAQHPDVYQGAVAEGREQGQEIERKRVRAHLTLADSSGAIEVAHKAIREGVSSADEEVQAAYLAHRMNASAQVQRTQEADAIGKAIDKAATPDPKAGCFEDQVLAELDKLIPAPVEGSEQ